MQKILTTLVCTAAFSLTSMAQDIKLPQPSPKSVINQNFSISEIVIEYSRPSAKGRKVFGGIVPYNEVWRTGANEATSIHIGEDLKLAGQPVKKGTYALYTIPGKMEWKVIINKGTSNWGTMGFDQKDNIATFTVPVSTTTKPVETFTISLENISNSTCEIVLKWENSKVTIPVEAYNTHEIIMSYLDRELKGENPPYVYAANYYLSNGEKLDEALNLTNKAIEKQDVFYLHWLKARILEKLGKKEEALKEAAYAAEKSAGTPYESEFKKHHNDMLERLK